MVLLKLEVKAELENVAKVELPGQWSLTVQQTQGDERREVIVDPDNEEQLAGSRGTCNFRIRWPGANKDSYLSLQPLKGAQPFLASETAGEFAPVAAFECRGLEPVEWNWKDGAFTVTTTGGKVFEDVTFEEGDWYDYDDEAGESVGVSNIEFRIGRA